LDDFLLIHSNAWLVCDGNKVTGYERIKAALEGRQPDRVPVMLHNFMLAAHEAGHSMAEFRNDSRIIAQSFIKAIEVYEYDGILVDIDTVTLAGAVGVPVDFPENQPARSHRGCLDSIEQVHSLPPVDVGGYKYIQIWLEAVRLLKDYFKDEIYIRGNCDQAPFSLASMMRTPAEWYTDLILHEGTVRLLLEYCTTASCQFIDLMAQTGADMLSNGDSPAGSDLISSEMYSRYALPYEQRLVDRTHEHQLPYALHICGDTGPILEQMLGTGADAIELDYKTDANAACRVFNAKATFIGNIDPVGILVHGTIAEVAVAAEKLIAQFEGNPRFILNAGCAIPADAPSENIREMIRVARQ
jgi:uroporphyrinogen decarboxylase